MSEINMNDGRTFGGKGVEWTGLIRDRGLGGQRKRCKNCNNSFDFEYVFNNIS